MSETYCVILTTTGSHEEADRIADLLVSRRLAACVQVMDVASTYIWEGRLQKQAECLLLIKTARGLYKQVEAAIVANHSYHVPEIVQLPIFEGLDRYLGWIGENTMPAA
jgi:periplasmic divalent cation tolerance protein